jgi:hypothetical protein
MKTKLHIIPSPFKCATGLNSQYITRNPSLISEFVSKVYPGFWWADPRERDLLEDLDVVWRIILKWIFEKLIGRSWTGSS